MFGKLTFQNQKNQGGARRPERALRAQAIVEFAIALPVLLMLLIGLMEVGRMLFMYASVVNSSRDAVRYASAYGRSDDGYLKYKYCAGIKQQAQLSGFLLDLQNSDISISYDTGPSGTSLGSCDAGSGEDADVAANTEDRVSVTVSATYNPILSLLPIPSRTFTATSSRTIVGIMKLSN